MPPAEPFTFHTELSGNNGYGVVQGAIFGVLASNQATVGLTNASIAQLNGVPKLAAFTHYDTGLNVTIYSIQPQIPAGGAATQLRSAMWSPSDCAEINLEKS